MLDSTRMMIVFKLSIFYEIKTNNRTWDISAQFKTVTTLGNLFITRNCHSYTIDILSSSVSPNSFLALLCRSLWSTAPPFGPGHGGMTTPCPFFHLCHSPFFSLRHWHNPQTRLSPPKIDPHRCCFPSCLTPWQRLHSHTMAVQTFHSMEIQCF